jgi:hypothetical protein
MQINFISDNIKVKLYELRLWPKQWPIARFLHFIYTFKRITTYSSKNCTEENSKLVNKTQNFENNARNETENKMIAEYVSHLRTDSLNKHKDSSRLWIKDNGTIVQTYIVFIESYRVPNGMRYQFVLFGFYFNKFLAHL